MNQKNVHILIPARLDSSRFPRKSLCQIKGKSLIQRVYEGCVINHVESICVTVHVVTDHNDIEEHVLAFGGRVFRVDDEVNSGTERIALAYERYLKNEKVDLIINVQGDEPLISADDIIKICQFHFEGTFDICTLIHAKRIDETDFHDANKVKVIWTEKSGECHYFSRAAIPYERISDYKQQDEKPMAFYHIGIYSFTPKSLQQFSSLQESYYEKLERLEQLRAIENGLRIGAVITKNELRGVDCPADIKIIEELLSE